MFNLGLALVMCVNRNLAYVHFIGDDAPYVFRRAGSSTHWRYRGHYWVPR